MKKFRDGQEVLMEQQHVLEFRFRTRICEVLKITGSGMPIIYTDGMYVHASHTVTFFESTTQITSIFCPGSANGCSPKVTLIFKSCQKFSGCYNNMDFCNNEKWRKCKLISKLPTSSLLITVNVAYCNAGQH